MKQTEFLDSFHTYVSELIDEAGVYPFPGISRFQDCKEIAAITDAELAFRWFFKQIAKGASECVVALDRTTKAGQGTEFDDVLTCLYWDGASIHSGVINYQHEPRIVRPTDWENPFWNFTMAKEIRQFAIRLFSVGRSSSRGVDA